MKDQRQSSLPHCVSMFRKNPKTGNLIFYRSMSSNCHSYVYSIGRAGVCRAWYVIKLIGRQVIRNRLSGLGEWWQPLPDGGLHDRPDTGEKLRKYFPDISVSWSSALVPSQKGEELHELHQRMSDCASIIIQRVGKVAGTRDGRKEDDRVVENLMNILSGAKCVVEDLTNDKHSRILFVGHVAPLIALIRMLIGESELPLRLGCASISTLRKETDTTIHRDDKVDNGRENLSSIGTYHPLKLNSSDHLADGEWIPWGFMDM